MHLALTPSKFIAFGVAIVVELHAKRFVDRGDRARDFDAPLRGVGFNHFEFG